MKGLASLMILCLVLAGCGYTTTERETDETYRTGSQGLELRFLDNNPPYKMYDSDPFSAIVEVTNAGATDITAGSNARVYLSGFDLNILTNIDTQGQVIEDVEGKSQYNPHGEFTHVEFETDVRDLTDRNIDVYDVTVLATTCYPYETIAQPLVCIDPDPYSRRSVDKVCDGNQAVSVGTQGAPVAVTNVDVESMPEKTKFRITVSNVGGGTVFKEGFSYLQQCSPYGEGLDYDDVDYVTVSGVTISDRDITSTCKPLKDGNQLRLVDGHGDIICQYSELSGPAIETPLRIKLNYGYRDSITRNIEIIATPD